MKDLAVARQLQFADQRQLPPGGSNWGYRHGGGG
jgi:hypothetical protein